MDRYRTRRVRALLISAAWLMCGCAASQPYIPYSSLYEEQFRHTGMRYRLVNVEAMNQDGPLGQGPGSQLGPDRAIVQIIRDGRFGGAPNWQVSTDHKTYTLHLPYDPSEAILNERLEPLLREVQQHQHVEYVVGQHVGWGKEGVHVLTAGQANTATGLEKEHEVAARIADYIGRYNAAQPTPTVNSLALYSASTPVMARMHALETYQEAFVFSGMANPDDLVRRLPAQTHLTILHGAEDTNPWMTTAKLTELGRLPNVQVYLVDTSLKPGTPWRAALLGPAVSHGLDARANHLASPNVHTTQLFQVVGSGYRVEPGFNLSVGELYSQRINTYATMPAGAAPDMSFGLDSLPPMGGHVDALISTGHTAPVMQHLVGQELTLPEFGSVQGLPLGGFSTGLPSTSSHLKWSTYQSPCPPGTPGCSR